MRIQSFIVALGLAGFGCSAETCGHTERAVESAASDVERGAEELKEETATGLQRAGEKMQEKGTQWEAEAREEQRHESKYDVDLPDGVRAPDVDVPDVDVTTPKVDVDVEREGDIDVRR